MHRAGLINLQLVFVKGPLIVLCALALSKGSVAQATPHLTAEIHGVPVAYKQLLSGNSSVSSTGDIYRWMVALFHHWSNNHQDPLENRQKAVLPLGSTEVDVDGLRGHSGVDITYEVQHWDALLRVSVVLRRECDAEGACTEVPGTLLVHAVAVAFADGMEVRLRENGKGVWEQKGLCMWLLHCKGQTLNDFRINHGQSQPHPTAVPFSISLNNSKQVLSTYSYHTLLELFSRAGVLAPLQENVVLDARNLFSQSFFNAHVVESVWDHILWPWTLPPRSGLASTKTRGAVLHGPPGTGKTTIARFLSTNVGFRTIFFGTSALLHDKYIGETEKKIRRLFEASRLIPSVPTFIAFEEVDVAAAQRQTSSEHSGAWLSVLLDLLSNPSFSNVVVMGTTNRRAFIDSAFIRAGRLETLIYVGKPRRVERARIAAKTFRQAGFVKVADTVQRDDEQTTQQRDPWFNMDGAHIEMAVKGTIRCWGAQRRQRDAASVKLNDESIKSCLRSQLGALRSVFRGLDLPEEGSTCRLQLINLRRLLDPRLPSQLTGRVLVLPTQREIWGETVAGHLIPLVSTASSGSRGFSLPELARCLEERLGSEVCTIVDVRRSELLQPDHQAVKHVSNIAEGIYEAGFSGGSVAVVDLDGLTGAVQQATKMEQMSRNAEARGLGQSESTQHFLTRPQLLHSIFKILFLHASHVEGKQSFSFVALVARSTHVERAVLQLWGRGVSRSFFTRATLGVQYMDKWAGITTKDAETGTAGTSQTVVAHESMEWRFRVSLAKDASVLVGITSTQTETKLPDLAWHYGADVAGFRVAHSGVGLEDPAKQDDKKSLRWAVTNNQNDGAVFRFFVSTRTVRQGSNTSVVRDVLLTSEDAVAFGSTQLRRPLHTLLHTEGAATPVFGFINNASVTVLGFYKNVVRDVASLVGSALGTADEALGLGAPPATLLSPRSIASRDAKWTARGSHALTPGLWYLETTLHRAPDASKKKTSTDCGFHFGFQSNASAHKSASFPPSHLFYGFGSGGVSSAESNVLYPESLPRCSPRRFGLLLDTRADSHRSGCVDLFVQSNKSQHLLHYAGAVSCQAPSNHTYRVLVGVQKAHLSWTVHALDKHLQEDIVSSVVPAEIIEHVQASASPRPSSCRVLSVNISSEGQNSARMAFGFYAGLFPPGSPSDSVAARDVEYRGRLCGVHVPAGRSSHAPPIANAFCGGNTTEPSLFSLHVARTTRAFRGGDRAEITLNIRESGITLHFVSRDGASLVASRIGFGLDDRVQYRAFVAAPPDVASWNVAPCSAEHLQAISRANTSGVVKIPPCVSMMSVQGCWVPLSLPLQRIWEGPLDSSPFQILLAGPNARSNSSSPWFMSLPWSDGDATERWTWNRTAEHDALRDRMFKDCHQRPGGTTLTNNSTFLFECARGLNLSVWVGSAVGVAIDQVPGMWIRVFAGFTVPIGNIYSLEQTKALARNATRVLIATGDDMATREWCVSRPNTFPIRELRNGRSMSHVDGGRAANYRDIAGAWKCVNDGFRNKHLPPHSCGHSRPLTGENECGWYWAGCNGNGLHMNCGDDKVGWVPGKGAKGWFLVVWVNVI